jgi:hypothetical protein
MTGRYGCMLMLALGSLMLVKVCRVDLRVPFACHN